MANASVHVRQADRGRSVRAYWPLASLILVSALAAAAIAAGWDEDPQPTGMALFMHAYMGVFLCVFALLKLFDLEGFKDGFSMYDVIGSHFSPWGYVYPFLELGLGLAYLAFVWPPVIYVTTIVVFAFSAVGVLLALRKGLDIACPCMGNVLSVPLSTVTLIEDVAMVAMATLLLLADG